MERYVYSADWVKIWTVFLVCAYFLGEGLFWLRNTDSQGKCRERTGLRLRMFRITASVIWLVFMVVILLHGRDQLGVIFGGIGWAVYLWHSKSNISK